MIISICNHSNRLSAISYLPKFTLIVIKSTVAPDIQNFLLSNGINDHNIIYIPEFLAEGCAI